VEWYYWLLVGFAVWWATSLTTAALIGRVFGGLSQQNPPPARVTSGFDSGGLDRREQRAHAGSEAKSA
jgi:hypothetical protein